MKGGRLAADDTAFGIPSTLNINKRDVGHRAVALDRARDPLRLERIEMSVLKKV